MYPTAQNFRFDRKQNQSFPFAVEFGSGTNADYFEGGVTAAPPGWTTNGGHGACCCLIYFNSLSATQEVWSYCRNPRSSAAGISFQSLSGGDVQSFQGTGFATVTAGFSLPTDTWIFLAWMWQNPSPGRYFAWGPYNSSGGETLTTVVGGGASTTIADSSCNFRLGSHPQGTGLDGKVCAFSYFLSSSSGAADWETDDSVVQAIYNGGNVQSFAQMSKTGLSAHYACQDVSGGLADSYTGGHDLSEINDTGNAITYRVPGPTPIG